MNAKVSQFEEVSETAWRLVARDSKLSSRLVITSVALQDHITRNLLEPDFLLSDPLLTFRSKAHAIPHARQTGTQRDAPRKLGQEREYVLDPVSPPLTLAQRMGLVDSPPERLSEDGWILVKARSVQQRESEQPCSICREPFCLQPQVLLSCSHVFHRACLQAFERFSGRKCCPMCRRELYETRVIHDAARLFQNQCAVRIQAFWRGYVTRKWYGNIRRTVCPNDKRLRRKFFEAKLQELSDSFVQRCHIDAEAFLSDIDRSLSSSRRVLRQLETKKHVAEPQEDDWERIQTQVTQRGASDCPICLTALCGPGSSGSGLHQRRRHSVLLSCSHLFHQVCLNAFEAFTADRVPACPLCRSTYHKKLI
ncbi:RING finger protein 32 isoform X2 [Syngnathoides biaculeatus]|uniref:RING finger protein 32 isoform X2 n=1 Tax=Syngnathoides biaculeatus TaxID=300417 RepID=UPI002ADE16EC|nr:RING finger protein 32 isoform X2 [Syngnathoides biaculeatus]